MHPSHTMGDDAYAWFGIIVSAARAVDSVVEGKQMLRVGSGEWAPTDVWGGY
jgi:hypothetical protein